MIIEFSVDKPQNWLQHVAEQFGIELKDNTINFPSHLGEGSLKHYYLSNGIVLNYVRFKFYKEIIFSRKAGEEVSFSPIMFFINNKSFEQNIDDEIKEIHSGSPNGIFWPSAQINSTWKVPVHEWFSHLTITINHQWLLKYCAYNAKNYIHQLLTSGKPFYIFEEITPKMQHIVSDIVELIENKNLALSFNLMLESKTTELLAVFIDKLTERPLNENIANLNSSDIEKLFKVRVLLLKNLSDTPQLKTLSENIGFSESKLQKLFKQVFGKSIYQYALYEKMIMAEKMLKSRRYSVSEVGYELGYSNLSHFTKAFKNQFGVTPKTFASSTRQ